MTITAKPVNYITNSPLQYCNKQVTIKIKTQYITFSVQNLDVNLPGIST